MAGFGKSLASTLFVLAVPILLFAGSLIWTVLNVGTYEHAFLDYGAAQRTGLGARELRGVATALAEHFRDGKPIDIQINKGGAIQPLFAERELIHLHDIYNLVQFGLRALGILGLYCLAFAVAGLAWWRGRYWHTLARHARAGALLTLALFVLVAVGSLLDFDQLFWTLHVISFPNDFWLLDPSKYYLINLFTQGFFQETALKVAVATAAEALLLTLVASVATRGRTRRGPAGRTS